MEFHKVAKIMGIAITYCRIKVKCVLKAEEGKKEKFISNLFYFIVMCASNLPDPWLPFQLKSITTFFQYQIILLGDKGTCVNNLPRVVT